MSEKKDERLNLFEAAIDESFVQDMKMASKAMYQIYSELVNAGFDKDSALKLMIALTMQKR